MYLVVKKTGNFGAHDLLKCRYCDGEMMLTRRTPHPKLGGEYEEQRFTCRKCTHEAVRSVDVNGETAPDPDT